jgi:O-antigen/teichoic acid export membrane protein
MGLLVAPAYRSAAEWLPYAAALSPAFLFFTLVSRTLINLDRNKEAGLLTLVGAVVTLALAAVGLHYGREPGAAVALCSGLLTMGLVGAWRFRIHGWVESGDFHWARLLLFAALSWPMWKTGVLLSAWVGEASGLPSRWVAIQYLTGLVLGALAHLGLATKLKLFSPSLLARRMGANRQ